MIYDTIPGRLLNQAHRRPESAAHYEKIGGAWKRVSWSEYARDVRRATKALLSLGVRPGDHTAILGFNRREWVIFAVATMCARGAPAGIYTTCSADEVAYIVGHSESRVVLVENDAQWKKIEAKFSTLPNLARVVFMRGAKPNHALAISWEEFLALGDAISDARVDEAVAAIEPKDVATLIYTSGTTGPPKAVMLSHGNVLFVSNFAQQVIHFEESDSAISYLPLSHIAEQMFTIHAPTVSGEAIYFAESIEKLGDNLKEVRPTTFFGVPRIWEKMHAGISAKLAAETGPKRVMIDRARKIGAAMSRCKMEGKEPPPRLVAEHALFDKLLFSKIKGAIGLGRARSCASGAAPIAREVLEFFASIDLPIYEVYGQSEDCGPTSFNRPGAARFGTVGPIIPGVEVRFGADDEILVRGPNVFLGYFKDPDATREALDGEWLRSGDLGKLDAEGFLHITGRKKEIIITAGGKNIAPKNIEAALKNHPLVGEAVVIGDRRKFLTALIALDPDAAAKFAREHGGGDPANNEAVRRELEKAIDEINETLARVETVKKFHVLAKPLSIEAGELTPTLKVKRKVVTERYAREIEAMYAE